MTAGLIKYLIAPFVCAFIGWLTNYLAIRMLFHPKRPVRVFRWQWQGLFPKRQKELARNLGRLVEQELVNHQDIRRAINDPSFLVQLRVMISTSVERFITRKLTSIHPVLNNMLKGAVTDKLKDLIVHEVEKFIPEMIERATRELESRLRFSHIVQEKIESFSMDKLENLLFTMMRKEFRFIELLGGLLGFLIGTVQSVFFYFT
jgi:uncharacterized membrane protein YheB (UPF0754 family)